MDYRAPSKHETNVFVSAPTHHGDESHRRLKCSRMSHVSMKGGCNSRAVAEPKRDMKSLKVRTGLHSCAVLRRSPHIFDDALISPRSFTTSHSWKLRKDAISTMNFKPFALKFIVRMAESKDNLLFQAWRTRFHQLPYDWCLCGNTACHRVDKLSYACNGCAVCMSYYTDQIKSIGGSCCETISRFWARYPLSQRQMRVECQASITCSFIIPQSNYATVTLTENLSLSVIPSSSECCSRTLWILDYVERRAVRACLQYWTGLIRSGYILCRGFSWRAVEICIYPWLWNKRKSYRRLRGALFPWAATSTCNPYNSPVVGWVAAETNTAVWELWCRWPRKNGWIVHYLLKVKLFVADYETGDK